VETNKDLPNAEVKHIKRAHSFQTIPPMVVYLILFVCLFVLFVCVLFR
jgi:hypothetical protein